MYAHRAIQNLLAEYCEHFDAGDFDDAFVAYCEKIAEIAPLAAAQTKRLVSRIGLPDDLEAHLFDWHKHHLGNALAGPHFVGLRATVPA